MQTVGGAAGDCAENVGLFFHLWHFDAASSKRLLGLWHQHFGHQKCAGSSHDDGSQQIFGIGAANLNVASHHTAGNVRHAAGHHDHQFRFREFGKERANGERSFSLTHEDAGGDVERFCAAGAHDSGHDPSGCADDELHDADVIENSEKRSDENNGGQNLKCKRKTQAGKFLGKADIAKDEFGAGVGVAEEFVGTVAEERENFGAGGGTQNEKTDQELQAESPENCLELD